MEPKKVSVGPCRCPGSPHAEDAVFLRPKVTNEMGIAAFRAIRRNGYSADDAEGAVAGVFLRFGIESWTFVDEKLEPEPITGESIERLLPFWAGGFEVAQEASLLYSGDLMHPLVGTPSKSSDDTPTESSIPPSPPSGPTPLTPSGRSSRRNGAVGSESEVPVP